MTKQEFHNKVSELASKGVMKREAFVQVYNDQSPFISYASYRLWKHRNGIKEPNLYKCAKCEAIAERKSHNQKYCNDCVPKKEHSRWSNIDSSKRKVSDEPDVTRERIDDVKSKRYAKRLIKKIDRLNNHYKECEGCGELFDNPQSKYCTVKCREWSYNIGNYERDRECVTCGKEFYKPYSMTGYRNTCSDECNSRLKRSNSWNSENKNRTDKYGGRYEYINRYEVLKADNYHCYLCGTKCIELDEWDSFVDNMATIDHVQPISLGGNHTRDNVRCCCNKCNLDKGVDTPGVQNKFDI